MIKIYIENKNKNKKKIIRFEFDEDLHLLVCINRECLHNQSNKSLKNKKVFFMHLNLYKYIFIYMN